MLALVNFSFLRFWLYKSIVFVNYLIFLLVISFCHVSYAKDFSIEGHTYKIIEEDILELIKKRLAQVDLDGLNKKIQARTKKYVERPTPASNIVRAKESKEYIYDPTYTLDEDILDHKGQLIHRSGTKVNPLEFTNLTNSLLFIDGDDKAQVDFALELSNQYQNDSKKQSPKNLKIILVNGSPLQLQRKYKDKQIWFYFDQGGFISQKLEVKEVPAIVEQDGLKLKIKIIDLSSRKDNITNISRKENNAKFSF